MVLPNITNNWWVVNIYLIRLLYFSWINVLVTFLNLTNVYFDWQDSMLYIYTQNNKDTWRINEWRENYIYMYNIYFKYKACKFECGEKN